MMISAESEILQSGLEALKQGSYQDAINSLEKFCQHYLVATETSLQKQYIQAQMGLVKARVSASQTLLTKGLAGSVMGSETKWYYLS